jgi:hypothetical protein
MRFLEFLRGPNPVRRSRLEQAEIVDTIGHFDQMTDPGHSLLRSAKGSLESIEGRPTSAALTM